MKVKPVNLKDFYKTLVKWWEGHNFPVVDSGFLSDKIFVCYNEKGDETYAISVYCANSGLCWLGFPVSNPNLTKEEKKGCFDGLLDGVIFFLKKVGYKYIFTTSSTKAVERKLLKFGFNEGDIKVNHYIKKL